MTHKPLKKGEGRVQFFACRERVAELTNQGYDLTAIHAKLVEEGRITMSYSGFYENVTGRRKNKPKTNRIRPKKLPAPAILSLEAPQLPTSGTEEFNLIIYDSPKSK